MRIIENHFEGKDTIIVGKLINNGCQTFTIEQLDKVCQEHKVPDDIKESCRKAYLENSAVEEDFESLVQYPETQVRRLVVKQGYGLDKLVSDEDWRVRAAVAHQGYGLDKLVNDEIWVVRRAVAQQGYGLDKLVSDEDWHVRAAVANQGYGLDTLVKDENEIVCAAAVKMKQLSN